MVFIVVDIILSNNGFLWWGRRCGGDKLSNCHGGFFGLSSSSRALVFVAGKGGFLAELDEVLNMRNKMGVDEVLGVA